MDRIIFLFTSVMTHGCADVGRFFGQLFSPSLRRCLGIGFWAPGAAILLIAGAWIGERMFMADSKLVGALFKSTALLYVIGILATLWVRAAVLSTFTRSDYTDGDASHAGSFRSAQLTIFVMALACLASVAFSLWNQIITTSLYLATLFVVDYSYLKSGQAVGVGDEKVETAPVPDRVRECCRDMAAHVDMILLIPFTVAMLLLFTFEFVIPSVTDSKYGSPFWSGTLDPQYFSFGLDRAVFMDAFTGALTLSAALLTLIHLVGWEQKGE